jgi:hypothetical protein
LTQPTSTTGAVRPIECLLGSPRRAENDADCEDLAASEALARVKTVGDVLGEIYDPFTPADPKTVIKLKDDHGDPAASGHWRSGSPASLREQQSMTVARYRFDPTPNGR